MNLCYWSVSNGFVFITASVTSYQVGSKT